MAAASPPKPVRLVCGEDEFAVKQRARQTFDQWTQDSGGFDHEIIDAAAGNGGEAIAALGRLREAIQTLPFFGQDKVVWFRNCNFLGDDRTAGAQAVTENLAGLAQELKQFSWTNVRLLISAGKVDKRKVFFKTLNKVGEVELFEAWSPDDRDWTRQAENIVRQELQVLGKKISTEALDKFIVTVGPNRRALQSELEKLALYLGDRSGAELEDVERIVSHNKQARAFALGEALGERSLPQLLQALDDELWEMKTSSQKSEIGLLYGLISKVRTLILLKEMAQAGWLKPSQDYARFKSQLAHVPAEALPSDKRFNPLAMHPYVLFRASSQIKNFSLDELVEAMNTLLECNEQLIFSRLDSAMILQQALIQIVTGKKEAAGLPAPVQGVVRP